MDFFFVDDAQQSKPSRPGMAPLMAVGGLHVPDETVKDLEDKLESLCSKYEFPPNEVFKWSPNKNLWMHNNLVGQERENFYIKALNLAEGSKACAIIIIEDTKSLMATKGAKSRDLDLASMLFERVHHQLSARQRQGIVIVSQPSGDRRTENKFLADCLESLKCGTDYVKPDRIALNILSSPPRFIRLLQLADVVTSCTAALVAGEKQFAPSVFEAIKPLFPKEVERIGGVGLKIHPDLKYANLYYWLVEDKTFWKRGTGYPLPWPGVPYNTNPDKP